MKNGEIEVSGIMAAWASRAVHGCLALKHGENALILVDEPLPAAREALLTQAREARVNELWSFTLYAPSRPVLKFPSSILKLARKLDAVLIFLSSLDLVLEQSALWPALRAFQQAGTRVGFGLIPDTGVIEQIVFTNHEAIAARAAALAERLRGCSTIRITAPLGTDLRMSVAGREWKADTGFIQSRGLYGHFPAGEVCIAPVEDSVEGVLMIDGSLSGLMLSEPVRVVIEKGRTAAIEGGPGADYLREVWRRGEEQPNGEWSRVIGGLGIGLNPGVRLRGDLAGDRKTAGTVHITWGRNDLTGGKNLSPLQINGVIRNPVLQADDRVILEPGWGQETM